MSKVRTNVPSPFTPKFTLNLDPPPAWGKQNPICQKPAIQNFAQGPLRDFRQIRFHPSNPQVPIAPTLNILNPPTRGVTTETRGTAFVVYEDIFDAKNAVDH